MPLPASRRHGGTLEVVRVESHELAPPPRRHPTDTEISMDAMQWNERHATAEYLWKADPNRFLPEQTAHLPVGRALDLACGEGRNAVWLAAPPGRPRHHQPRERKGGPPDPAVLHRPDDVVADVRAAGIDLRVE